mgnify:CR=1 FL=1
MYKLVKKRKNRIRDIMSLMNSVMTHFKCDTMSLYARRLGKCEVESIFSMFGGCVFYRSHF